MRVFFFVNFLCSVIIFYSGPGPLICMLVSLTKRQNQTLSVLGLIRLDSEIPFEFLERPLWAIAFFRVASHEDATTFVGTAFLRLLLMEQPKWDEQIDKEQSISDISIHHFQVL